MVDSGKAWVSDLRLCTVLSFWVVEISSLATLLVESIQHQTQPAFLSYCELYTEYTCRRAQ